jgi:xanthine/uracil/vitamin C permease (AzgA family)
MTLAISIFLASILVALIGSCLAVGYATAFWQTKATLLGVRPTGILVLYKASLCLSILICLVLASPLGLFAAAPAVIIGSTMALINVSHMDDQDRVNFLIHNRTRYADPHQIEMRNGSLLP